MQPSVFLRDVHAWRLIAAGLVVVVLAQLVTGLPLAGAIALIGFGATRHLGLAASWPVAACNALVYAGIAFVAVGAEAHGGQIAQAIVFVDGGLAFLLVTATVAEVVRLVDGAAAPRR
ncbi:MAG: hypothetical protein AAGA92_01610 [Planctomycetota bacterium]